MNTIKKKVMLAGVVAIFAFIATVGATYAWFTLGSTSEVSDIQLTISTDVSLLILMDDSYDATIDSTFLHNAANYSTELTTAMIKAAYDYSPIVMAPVTTSNGQTFLRNDRSTTAVFDPLSETPLPEYLEFSVWLFSQDKAMDVQ